MSTDSLGMDELFHLHPHGLFLRREALARGYSDKDLKRGLREQVLARPRQGAYVPATTWSEASNELKHLIRAQAISLTHHNGVALSHTTGALAWGMRLWEPDLARVHANLLTGATGRIENGLAYHSLPWEAENLWNQDEHLLMDPVSCALHASRLTSVEGAVVILDSVLHLGLATPEELWKAFARIKRMPFSLRLQVALRLMDAGGESVAESRLRYLFWLLNIPMPVLQHPVYDDQGRLVGICDFAWPKLRMLGEMDGKLKYTRGLLSGEDPGEVVFREKKREDRLREVTGFGMIRYTYGDLYLPQATAQRTRQMLLRSAAG